MFYRIVVIMLLLSIALVGQSKMLSPHGKIKWECENCHTPRSFHELRKPMEFNHKETGFPLVGRHRNAQCIDCHGSLKFAEVGSACADCHDDAHKGHFGFNCQSCHEPERWHNEKNILEIHATRGFALVGAHSVVDCQSCHIQEQRNEFVMTPVECVSCHLEDYLQSSRPDHIAEGFDFDCQPCHNILSIRWEYLGGLGFDFSKLPRTGK